MDRPWTYATVCSGIECMSAACADMPLKPVFFSEIEPFPCAVLKSHFPNVPNLGDMSKIEVTNDGKEITNGSVRIALDKPLDIFAGGTPCQDVSVAGKRGGMQEGSGTRSSLAFEFVRLVRELKPRYVLWENVAGVLSDKSFPEFLTALADCGYGVAYRTLDAQWVRVADCYHPDGRVVGMERAIPQRRRRVWVVGCLGGDVTRSAQILFEHPSIAGNTPPRRRTGQEITRFASKRNRVHDCVVGGEPGDDIIALDGDKLKPRTNQRKGGNGFGINEDGAGYTLTGVDRHGVAYKRTNAKGEDVAATLSADDITQSGQGYINNSVDECYENHAQDSRVKPIEVAPIIPQKAGTGGNNLPLAVFNKVSHARSSDGDGERWAEGDVASTRNTFDIGDKRAQEVKVSEEDSAVTLRASDGKCGDNQPTVAMNFKYTAGSSSQYPYATQGEAQALSAGNHDAAVAIAYDGFNQSGKEECCHTLGTCNSESPNNDKVAQSFGINPQGGQMLPFDHEISETLAIGHQGGVCIDNIISQMRYIVRRLTPTEYERLMGLQDGWTIPCNLTITDELVEEFRQIHDNFGRIMAEYDGKPAPKPKTANQVRKWLEKITNPDTCPDAPRYKGCGNGWAANQPRWILARMLAKDGIDPWGGEA